MQGRFLWLGSGQELQSPRSRRELYFGPDTGLSVNFIDKEIDKVQTTVRVMPKLRWQKLKTSHFVFFNQ